MLVDERHKLGFSDNPNNIQIGGQFCPKILKMKLLDCCESMLYCFYIDVDNYKEMVNFAIYSKKKKKKKSDRLVLPRSFVSSLIVSLAGCSK